MEKQHKIAKIYGYAVCLVAVITFLISTTSLVNAVIDSGDPLHVEVYSAKGTPSLASFDNYKMDVLQSPDKESAYVPDDKTLRNMFEAAKTDKIQSIKHRTRRSIIVDIILIALCFMFFTTHWMWMRKLSTADA